MQLIDTHCHLASEKLKDSFLLLLERARQAGVQKVIDVGYDFQTSLNVLEHIQISDMVYGAVGLQPHDAHSFTVDLGERIKTMAQNQQKIVAIGEIGLDAHYRDSSLSDQIDCFEYFLQSALDLDLPVIVHMRETHKEVLSRLQSFARKSARKGVIHCFTGTLEQAKDYLSCDFFLSFSGIVTFKNAQKIWEVVQFIPDESLLIETDSPYLAPVPVRGSLNEPANLKYICNFIAKLRNISYNECAVLVSKNAEKLFFDKESYSKK